MLTPEEMFEANPILPEGIQKQACIAFMKTFANYKLDNAATNQTNDFLKRLIDVDDKIKELMSKLKQEQFDDIHSVLNAKMFIDSVIELETKKTLLIDILSKINK